MKLFFRNKTSKFDLNLFCEKWYPFIISLMIVIIYLLFSPVLTFDNLDGILNAIISFTSILLGFIGVLIALIFSLLNLSIVGNIFKSDFHRELMHLYFRRCIQSGFVLIGFTVLLFFRNTITHYLCFKLFECDISVLYIVKVIWLFLTPYFSLTSYRIITIVLHAAFVPYEEEKPDKNDTKHNNIRDKYK